MKKRLSLSAVTGRMKGNGAFFGVLLMLLIGCIINPTDFFTARNLINVTRQSATNGLLAFGMTYVMICGSIDISVASMLPLSAFLSLYISNYSTVFAFIVPVIVCAAIGAFNGVLISKLNFPAMIATFSTQLFLRGVVHVLTGNSTYRPHNENAALRVLSTGSIFGVIPVATVLLLVMFFLLNYLLKYQPTVRNIYAVGGNEEAAMMMGVNQDRTLIIAHIFCGAMAGLAGILMGARTGGAVPLGGDGYEMLAIASAVIGGTYLSGGRGKLSGTLFGALVIGLLSNEFKMQDILRSHWERVFIGSILLAVLLIQSAAGADIKKVKKLFLPKKRGAARV